MKSWQEKCADIIEFLESYFPEEQYRLIFRKDKYEWILMVEKVRNDRGPHQGAAIDWLRISASDIDSLPEKMLDKAKERINLWQQDALDEVRKQAKQLEEARNELEKRLSVNNILKKLNTEGILMPELVKEAIYDLN